MTATALHPKTLAGKRYAAIRERDLARGLDHSMTDAAPVREHIAYLHTLGFSYAAIGSARGVSITAVTALADSRWPRVRGVAAAEWLAITPQQIFTTAPDGVRVANYAAVRRWRALMAIGHATETVTATALDLTGVNPWLNAITRDPRIAASRHRAVAAAFDALAMTPGPAAVARGRARAAGYAPPLAWDDIDDPTAAPIATHRDPADIDNIAVDRALAGTFLGTLTPAEERAAITIGLDRGMTHREIGTALGVTREVIQKRISRARDAEETAA